jgi:MYXO-CTERM domain-containing protein
MSPLRIACPLAALALSLVRTPPAAAAPTEPNQLTHQLTPAADCTNCHSFGNADMHADDPLYAPYFGWQGSMMGNSARDPVFWAGVAIASQDDPGNTSDCVRCHAPRAFLEGRGDAIAMDELTPPDLAGVECELCHRMVDDAGVPAGNARYTVDDIEVNGEVPRRGPWAYEDGEPGDPPHEWVNDPFTGGSRMCGTCHDVTTPRERLDDDGVGLGVSFNEQRTYSEWLGSDFAVEGAGFRSCQDCHMPAVTDAPGCFDNANAGVVHATGGRRHDLVGANRFMTELLRDIYGTDEIADFYFDNSIERMDEMLATAASMEVEAPADVDLGVGLSGLAVTVTNNTGHKLPTGYSEGRVMWIEVIASYGDTVVWSSGAWDGTAMPTDDPQLHTYRGVAEQLESGTTLHLLLNDHWVEDTRLPPAGLVANIETDPVGDRYTMRGDGTWPNTDTAQYAFDGNQDVVDGTPANADDDTLEVSVRLLYVVNTREYVEFLADANKTNNAGMDVLGLFEDAGFAQPIELATTNVSIPITGFGAAGESSSSSGGPSADTSSSGGSVDSDTGPDPVTSGSDESTSAMADDDGGGGGCECRTTSAGAPWLLLPFVALVRRRQPKRRPSTNLRHAASKRFMSRS